MLQENKNMNVLDLFEKQKMVKVCAPMVRYSKLQFRNLVKLYDCDLTFTPMILADSFCLSEKARRNELTTNLLDTPLITQFAANSVYEFVGAAHLSSPYCNGVDLNCGCPQKWAKELELGCAMLKKPELVYDIVRQCRNRISKPFTLELCGVSFLSVHARTSNQFTGEINKNILKLIKENCNIPIIANGGLTSLEDCVLLQTETNCDGFMVANGLLTNPMLFSGSTTTSVSCIQNWLNICYNSTLNLARYENELKDPKCVVEEKPYNLTFQCFHHHLVFMLEKVLPRKEKRIFNNLKSFSDVLEFIRDYFDIRPQLYEPMQFYKNVVLDLDFFDREEVYRNLKSLESFQETNEAILYDCEDDGKYFKNKISPVEKNSECDWSNLFLEND
ncbi:tRNA-dihydrouridine(20a/20b) synthase [NAD(P)+]-like [Anoplophora glabripennis]|uniref:tRNA-dihydrouridine(20a/20b) synthase [NAD(P)+]-like n=1 Tax=Anoplophora glabripennis TaxID=217634 RepID=UPI000874BFC4|nr:tRNA-dihydrouridine(20a/20b) synthase [NAD(P)+]-like [Anoplophora glabripennis]